MNNGYYLLVLLNELLYKLYVEDFYVILIIVICDVELIYF